MNSEQKNNPHKEIDLVVKQAHSIRAHNQDKYSSDRIDDLLKYAERARSTHGNYNTSHIEDLIANASRRKSKKNKNKEPEPEAKAHGRILGDDYDSEDSSETSYSSCSELP